MAEVKALAGELPTKLEIPLSRFSRARLRRHVLAAGIVAEISGTTIWRWLSEDAIRPWNRRSRVFPRLGRVEDRISVVAFDALVAAVMGQEPYRTASRVFWILDGGTIHRDRPVGERLQSQRPNLVVDSRRMVAQRILMARCGPRALQAAA